MFNDATRTVSLDLPAGWALDAVSSSLTELVFLDWTAATARQVFVRVQPSHTAASESDMQWDAAVRAQLPAEVTRLELRREQGQPWLAVERPGREGRVAQRWAVVRGPRLDTVIEHCDVPLGGLLATPELVRAVHTLDVPANRHLGGLRSQAEFAAANQAAHAAHQQGDMQAALQHLQDARQIATDLWLYSLTGLPLPEVPAAMAQAEADLALAGLARSALFLQRATWTLYRCRTSLARLMARSLSAQQQRLDALLDHAMKMHGEAAAEATPRNPFTAALQRSRLLVNEAEGVLQTPQPGLALPWARQAVQDGQGAAAMAGRHVPRSPSPQAAALLVSQGVTDEARQRELTHQLVVVTALEQLVNAGNLLTIACTKANEKVDLESASNQLLAARMLLQLSPGVARAFALVQALSGKAQALDGLGDLPSLTEAHVLLEEAQQQLDQLGEEGELRGRICLNLAWVRHSLRQLPGSLALTDRAVACALAAKQPRLLRAARSLRSQFLMLEGRLDEARQEAQQALDSPGDDAASTHHLNLATVLLRMNDHTAALQAVRDGLAAGAVDEALSPEVLRLLFVGAAVLESGAAGPGLAALALTEAAEALLDVLRLRQGEEADRIGFDDAERHRQLAATLVQRRLAANDFLGALAAADRHRARSLAQALGFGVVPGTAYKPAPAPPQAGAPLTELVNYIDTLARHALVRQGALDMPDGAALCDLVAHTGRATVLMHPSGEQLLLFLIRPGASVGLISATAAAPMSSLLALTDNVREQLGIVVTARAARGQLPQPELDWLAAALADNDDDADADAAIAQKRDALQGLCVALHEGLFSSLLPMLRPGEPLVVVPFRELGVVPLAVLCDARGQPLAERHALSVLPSIASLSRLATDRGTDLRALVVGDPLSAASARLQSLPGAATEARRVAAALAAAGWQTCLLLQDQATEAAVRAQLRGARVLHLACHAAVREPASASPLFLAPNPPEDGLLLPAEIAELPLDGALVVLAACQSGLGRATADGVLGLGRAFLQAGAHAVVLSLWRVSDAATSALMQAFYAALLGQVPGEVEGEVMGPMDVAGALRHAQLSTRRLVCDDPSDWGPWLVVGDGGWRLPVKGRA